MKRWFIVLGLASVSVSSISPSTAQEPTSAESQQPVKSDAEPKPSAKASPAPMTATEKPLSLRLEEIPKDPEGIKGISPYWEAIVQGDALTLALDFDAASEHYRNAIALLPRRWEGHLRMAELSLKQDQMTQAQEFISAALRFAEDDLRAKIHATLLLASMRELQRAHEDAIDSYRKYEALDGALLKSGGATSESARKTASGPQPPRVLVETAQGRIGAIEKRMELEEQYAVVVERIKKNVEVADRATGAQAGD